MAINDKKKNKTIKIFCVVGARPNFIKIAPIVEEIGLSADNMDENCHADCKIIHTGQHYDYVMSDAFFKELNIPKPDYNLEIGSGTHGEQTGKVMIEFERVCMQDRPDLIIVVGDVNSTLAVALVAAKLRILLAHVEAGLRSFDRDMPEEINRMLTDRLSDYLFVTEQAGIRNLEKEGIDRKRIFYVGNVMIDSLLKHKKRILDRDSQTLSRYDLRPQEYALLTLHRPSNVDHKENIRKLFGAFRKIARKLPIIFPAHPRTLGQMKKNGLEVKDRNIIVTEPLSYVDNLNLIANSKFVMTDSGGIQEETTVLKVPCLTLRANTERPVTIELGTNVLVGQDADMITREAEKILAGRIKKGKTPKYWDGKTSKRIIDILLRHFR